MYVAPVHVCMSCVHVVCVLHEFFFLYKNIYFTFLPTLEFTCTLPVPVHVYLVMQVHVHVVYKIIVEYRVPNIIYIFLITTPVDLI